MIDAPSDIEILNPDHVVSAPSTRSPPCAWSSTVENGKGYVPAERNRPQARAHRPDRGRCALFAGEARGLSRRADPPGPVRSTTTTSLHRWKVETNGAVTPVDAVAYAVRILQDQLQDFITFEEPKKPSADEGAPELPFNPALL